MIRHGEAPYLEASSKGDTRFSAFYAKIVARGNKSIEEIYQSAKVFEDGEPLSNWKLAKGKKAINQDEVHRLYRTLWNEYLDENPNLKEILTNASGISDVFGQEGHCCQATELWSIRTRLLTKYVIVAGSRNYDDYISFSVVINKYVTQHKGSEIVFISGMAATGADALILQWCADNGYKCLEYPAKWNDITVPNAVIKLNKYNVKYNALAGHMRNAEMASIGTDLIAFFNGTSPGTKNMIALAEKKKMNVKIVPI